MGASPAGLFDVAMKCCITCRGLGEIGESLAALHDALEHAKAWANPDAARKACGQTMIMLVEHGDYAEAARIGHALWDEGVRDGLTARTLRFAPLEVAIVAQAARDLEVQILGPDTVDKEDIERASGRVTVLHLTGHGSFDDRSPYRSGMYLARDNHPDALWTTAEVFSEVEAPAGRLAVSNSRLR